MLATNPANNSNPTHQIPELLNQTDSESTPKTPFSKSTIIWNWFAKRLLNVRQNGWNLLLRTGMEVYVELLLWSLLNLKQVSMDNPTDKNSTTLAYICLAMWVVFAIVVFCIWLVGYKYLKDPQQYNNKVGTLTEGLKTKKWSMLEHLFFLVRRTVLVILVVFGESVNTLQLWIFAALWIIVLAFEILVQPFQHKSLNVQNIITEGLLLTLVFLFFGFLKKDTELITSGYGAVIGHIWVAVVISIVLLHYVFHIGNWLVRRKKEKTKKIIKIEIQKRILNDMALKVFPLNARFQTKNYLKVNHDDSRHFNTFYKSFIYWINIHDAYSK
jgi:hypothetical protein